MILLKAVFALEVGGAKDAQAARTGHLAREGVSPVKHNSSLGGRFTGPVSPIYKSFHSKMSLIDVGG